MGEISEKLEFMKTREVKVCTKAGVGRSPGHKKPCFCVNFQPSRLGKENL